MVDLHIEPRKNRFRFTCYNKTCTGSFQEDTSKHETLNQCWFNVGPPSTTWTIYWPNFGSMSRICWDIVLWLSGTGIAHWEKHRSRGLVVAQCSAGITDVGTALSQHFTFRRNLPCAITGQWLRALRSTLLFYCRIKVVRGGPAVNQNSFNVC